MVIMVELRNDNKMFIYFAFTIFGEFVSVIISVAQLFLSDGEHP